MNRWESFLDVPIFVTHQASEKRQLPWFRFIVENRTAIERGRDRLFVSYDRIEFGLGFKLGLDRANEAFQPTKAVELVSAAEFCLIERCPEKIERFVIGLQRHRKRMAIFTAMGK